MAKVKSLINSCVKGINTDGLRELKAGYDSLLLANLFPKLPADDEIFAMIQYLKRKGIDTTIRIGPYEHITPFEAANRIASDLVIINGLLQVIDIGKIQEDSIFTVRLGTRHENEKGDFSIVSNENVFEGEAFNVAPSFYKAKLNKTLNKWRKLKKEKNLQLNYILVNAEVTINSDEDRLRNEGIQLIGVKNWADPIK